MKNHYVAPKFNEKSFTCPHCQVLSNQNYYDSGYTPFQSVIVSICDCCNKKSIWFEGQMVYPRCDISYTPNEFLTDEIKKIYNEAALIFNDSPKGACALLRLALQKLCIHLGEKGKNLNDDIASLVDKGLPKRIQEALDIVRVVGNNAVHPGKIAIEDNTELAEKLFKLVNIIAEKMIEEDKIIGELFEKLPEPAKEAITKRDTKSE